MTGSNTPWAQGPANFIDLLIEFLIDRLSDWLLLDFVH